MVVFRWYAEATVCYAHLADFHADTGSSEPVEKMTASLRHCRWFHRGWTLQELIAPPRVEFFDKHWEQFGSRDALSDVLEAVTDIDESVLSRRGQDVTTLLENLTIAKRMSWAKDRETTRSEDVAYCLLGLFQVHMPMLYGEGERAFIRLQEQIMKDSNDLTLFAWEANAHHDQGERLMYRGILARNPQEFARSGDLIRTGGADFGPEFALTNKVCAPVPK